MTPLPRSFYQRHTVTVAQELLGKCLVFGPKKGFIIETEAYRGSDDEASHAYRGLTPRTRVMFGPAGHSYVYLIYGIHHCLNLVTEEEGHGSGVLIRGLYTATGAIYGPGKVCQYLGITRIHNGQCVITDPSFYVTEGLANLPYQATPRIGITKAVDKPWRFVVRPQDLSGQPRPISLE